MVRRACGLLLLLGACADLDPAVLYRCEPGGGCLQAGFSCWSDGFCRPQLATGGGGGTTGGGGGGATGGGGGSVCTPCPGNFCGFFDGGCGELDCGGCTAARECGVTRPNRCDVPHLCTQEGWCFENPLPQGHTIRGAWAAGPREVYFVGDNGTALLWNGERHAVVALPPLAAGVDLYSVHGTSGQDIFIVGSRGTILHFDGTSWSQETIEGGVTPSLRSVWARSGRESIAVGAGTNLIRRQADAGWKVDLPTDGPLDLNDVTAGPDGLMYALGTYVLANPRAGVMRERDGGSSRRWDPLSPPPLINGNSLWVSPDGGFFLAGVADAGAGLGRVGLILKRGTDAGWEELVRVPDELRVLRGLTSDDLFAAGDNGLFVHVVDGGASLARLGQSWTALVPLPAGPMVEGRSGQVARSPAPDGGLISMSAGTALTINGLCASPPADLFAASQGTPGCIGALCAPLSLERNTVGRWLEVPHTLADSSEFSACATFLSYRWLVGDDTAFLYNLASGWNLKNPLSSGLPHTRSNGIWVENGVTTWITNLTQPPPSALPHVTRLAGSPLSQVPRAVTYDGGGDLVTAIGGARGRGWALGQRGLAFSITSDAGLEPAARLGADDFTAISYATLLDGGDLVIAAGLNGQLYRQEGTAGFVAESALGADLFATWVGATGDAFVVGADVSDGGRRVSRVFRRVGSSWVSVPFRGDQVLRAVWAGSIDGGLNPSVWVGGPGGLILRKD